MEKNSLINDKLHLSTKIMIAIWFILIIHLFSFWLWIRRHTYWIPKISYEWTLAWVIWIIFFTIAFYLYFQIKITINKKSRFKYALWILLLWILWNPIFYLLAPDFRFYQTPVRLQYINSNWDINIDKYLYYIWKYCIDKPYLFNKSTFKMETRYYYCWEMWKIRSIFKNHSDYIKVFDFTNKNNMKSLYELTYDWLIYYWYEKVIKTYKDKTFQARALLQISDLWLLNLMKQNAYDNEIEKLIDFNIREISSYHNNTYSWSSDKHWKNIDYINDQEIKKMIWVNLNVLY